MVFMLLQQSLVMRNALNLLTPEPAWRGTVLAEGFSAACGTVRRDLLRIMYPAVTTLSV
jgi:hypothetical protein